MLVLHCSIQIRIPRDKHSSLLVPFVSYKVN
jgi:hypothetical protein